MLLKTTLRSLLVMLAVAVGGAANAQITLQSSDVASAGDFVIYKTSNYADTVGSKGANRWWDFSALDGIGNDTARYLSPANTPAGEAFAGTNLAMLENRQYVYFNKASNGLFLKGIVLGEGLDSIPFLPVNQLKFAMSPPIAILRFPANYNTSEISNTASDFTFPYDTTIANPSGGAGSIDVDSVRIILNVTVTDSLNGYGTLVMPNDTLQALRQLLVQDYTFGVEVFTRIPLPFGGSLPLWIPVPIPLPAIRSNTCRYWAKDKKAPVLEFTLDSAGTTITGTRFQSKESLATSIEGKIIPFNLTLSPNPANQSVTIGGVQFGKVEIYNRLGYKVKEVNIASIGSSTSISVAEIPTGLYIVRISTQGKVIVRQLVVVH